MTMTDDQKNEARRKQIIMWVIILLVLALVGVGAWMYFKDGKHGSLSASSTGSSPASAMSPQYRFKFY